MGPTRRTRGRRLTVPQRTFGPSQGAGSFAAWIPRDRRGQRINRRLRRPGREPGGHRRRRTEARFWRSGACRTAGGHGGVCGLLRLRWFAGPRPIGPDARARAHSPCRSGVGCQASGRGAWPIHARLANMVLSRQLRRLTGIPLTDLGPFALPGAAHSSAWTSRTDAAATRWKCSSKRTATVGVWPKFRSTMLPGWESPK